MPLVVGITSALGERAACSAKGAASVPGAHSEDAKVITLNALILGASACKQRIDRSYRPP